MDFFQTVGTTVYHHDFHTDNLHPFWTADYPEGTLIRSPRTSVLRQDDFSVVDALSIVNPDGTETPVATYAAVLDTHVVWLNSDSPLVHVSGMTAATLLPPAIVPGGLEAVTPQPFNAHLRITRAIGSFQAVARAADGSTIETFHAVGTNSDFAEAGSETLGALLKD